MTTPPEQPSPDQPSQEPSGNPYPQPSGYGQAPPPPAWTPPAGYPPHPGPYPYAPVPPSDGQGIASMVLGIIALVGACGYGLSLILAPVALFLGRASIKRIDASQGQIGGRGFAQAGFIMGIIGTVLLALLIVVVGVFFTALFSTDCFGDGC